MRKKPLKRSGFRREPPPRTPPSAPSRGRGGVVASAAGMNPVIEKVVPVRDEAYRRLVASLPCIRCGIQGHSQAAHANTGKGGSTKADDRRIFPLCADRPGAEGCHTKFDQRALYSKKERREIEERWISQTSETLRAAGLIP